MVSVENSASSEVVELICEDAVGDLGKAEGAYCSRLHGVVIGACGNFILCTELQVAVFSNIRGSVVYY